MIEKLIIVETLLATVVPTIAIFWSKIKIADERYIKKIEERKKTIELKKKLYDDIMEKCDGFIVRDGSYTSINIELLAGIKVEDVDSGKIHDLFKTEYISLMVGDKNKEPYHSKFIYKFRNVKICKPKSDSDWINFLPLVDTYKNI